MSIGRYLSIGAGVVTALLVGALLFYIDTRESVLTRVLAACVIGSAVSALHWFVMGSFAAELRHITEYAESLGRSDNTPTDISSSRRRQARRGMHDLADAISRSVGTLRQRVDSLVANRRELEVQLRISDAERQHAEAILNAISDAVIVTDAFNELALANESAERLLRFDLEQSIRKPVDDIITDQLLVKLIKDTREGACGFSSQSSNGSGQLRRHVEHRMPAPRRDAAVFDVTLAGITGQKDSPAGPTAHQAAETAGVVTILRDVTREKEISEMKSNFVSSVSHELRTPLSSIKAYVEMLIDGEAPDEETQHEFYNIIQSETNRLQRLIDNILNISRIESGVVKTQREHISLPELIREAIDVMLPQARAKQIELVDVPTPVFFQVFADKDMIYQALLNLIGNAIKYTPGGGDGRVCVSVSVDEHDNTVNVSVSDNGVGIPKDDLPNLFDKFYRVNDHKKIAKGTGLGLNLVKQIVETVHDGKVFATSQPDTGSTFTFSLPMAENGY